MPFFLSIGIKSKPATLFLLASATHVKAVKILLGVNFLMLWIDLKEGNLLFFKDLFNKGYSLKFLKDKSSDDLREDIESPRYVDSHSKKRQRFFPDVDFTTASNFARFGLAEEYYDAAIKRIYQMYPYDGSQAEKLDWENESTYLDLFIFENEYPRTNGFITMGQSSSFAGSRDSKYNIFSKSH